MSAVAASGRTGRRLGWAIVLVFCAVFTLKGAGGLGAPFAYHGAAVNADAYNDAVWSTGARALRESGIVDSKLGAVWSDAAGDRYANHPPAIYPATALTQWLVGDDELGARLLVFVASIAAAVLLFLLLRELGLAPILAAASVVVGLSVPMFLTYGTMLDTVMLALPFAVAYLFVWQKSLDGRPILLPVGFAAAAVCLVAWEGVPLVAATMLVTAVVRRNREGVRTIVAAGAGAAVALGVTALWLLWVHGSLTPVLDQGARRAGGGTGFSFGEYVDQQLSYLRDLFGTPAMVVLVIGAVALLTTRRFRPIGLATLATSLLYAGGFREGSFAHDYWNYWLVITLVLGIGAIAAWLSRLRPRTWMPPACLLAVGLVVFGVAAEPRTAGQRAAGERHAADEAPRRQPARGQRWVPVVNDVGELGTAAWWVAPEARFYLEAPLRFVTAARAVAYATRHPDAWVVLDHEPVRGRDVPERLAERP